MHDTSSNTSRITVPTGGGGKYLFGAATAFAANATGSRFFYLQVNGATIFVDSVIQANTTGGDATMQALVGVWAMVAADYAEHYVIQSSGGALNVSSAASYTPEFWAFWFRT